jgi:hypothetical protein
MNAELWTAKNPLTRKYEPVDVALAELPPGTRLIRAYRADDRYVTIPGASLYIVSQDGQVVPNE